MDNAERFLRDFSRAILDDTAAVFVGAGTSMAAGYPSWKVLLTEIGQELGLHLEDFDDLAAVAQWAVQQDGSSKTRVAQAIVDQISPERPIPPGLEVLARLPIRAIWTTNYDRLIERAFSAISRPYDLKATQSQLSLKGAFPGSTKIYKMHGSIEDTHDLVIATDDYELYKSGRGSFLNLLEAQMLSNTFLFTGVSLTDPNIRHVLSAIRHRFPKAPPNHFLITKLPDRSQFSTDEAYDARLTRHRYWASDLQRYGFRVVEVEEYSGIDKLLMQLESRVAKDRVWISGSWPQGSVSHPSEPISEMAEAVGHLVAESGKTLVSGSGLTVGPAALRGFLDGLQQSGAWDLERRLIVRPFPQPLKGEAPNRAQWQLLREEMARLSGTILVLGGLKADEDGKVGDAAGVHDEVERVQRHGGFILPVGATGGAAALISKKLQGSSLPATGANAVRPTDDQLEVLNDTQSSMQEILAVIKTILQAKGRK